VSHAVRSGTCAIRRSVWRNLSAVASIQRLATFTGVSLAGGISRLAQHIGSPGPLKLGFSLVLDVPNAGDISGFVFADHAQPVG
jgi:hypothetical protein